MSSSRMMCIIIITIITIIAGGAGGPGAGGRDQECPRRARARNQSLSEA